MLNTIEGVKAFIRENGPLWRIMLPANSDEKNNRSVFKFDNLNEGGINESISKFMDIVRYLNGKYLIVASPTRLEGNGLAREYFEIYQNGLIPQPTIQAPAVQISGTGDIGQIIEEKVQNRLREIELEQLKRENEKLKSEISGPTALDRLIEAILPYKDLLVPAVIGMLTKKTPAAASKVAGLEHETKFEVIRNEEKDNKDMEQLENEIETRITNALTILAKHDPNLHIHLEKLSELAENNTKQFQILLSMLDKM